MLGGLLVPACDVREFEHRLQRWRNRRGLVGEISWKKTTPSRVGRYQEFVTGTLLHANRGRFRYRSTVFCSKDNALFPGVSDAERLSKHLHQFLLHSFGMALSHQDRLWIYPDEDLIPSGTSPSEVRQMLNCGIARRRNQFSSNIVQWVSPTDSKASHFIQMADILSGVIGSSLNRNYDPTTNRGQAKEQLINHTLLHVGKTDFNSSIRDREDFGVWHFEPQRKKRPRLYLPEEEFLAVPRLSKSSDAS